jgi:hypothetical protein
VVKAEAYLVQQIYSGGYNFHTADYYDGTRVVTCLDGDLKGYQGVSVNGVLQTEGFGAEWHNGYFIHYYERGKITSYPKKQTIELY